MVLIPSKGGAGGISTYQVTVDGSNYTGIKTAGDSTISSSDVLETVVSAVLTNKGASNPAKIQFGTGTFIATGAFDLSSHEAYHFSGQGQDITTVQLNTGNVNTTLFSGIRTSTNTAHGLNAVARGDNTITLTTGSQEDQYAAEDWIRVFSADEIDGADSNKKNGEIHRIKSITTDDSGVITLYSGIITSLWTTPEVVKMDMKEGIGYSDFTIEDIRTGVTNQTFLSGISETFAANVYLDHMGFKNCWWGASGFGACFNTNVQGCNYYKTQIDQVAYDIMLSSSQNNSIVGNNHFVDWHGVTLIAGGDATASADARNGRCINTTIANSTFQGTNVHSIDTHDGAAMTSIIGNTITSSLAPASDNAILLRSPANVSNNVINGGFAAGIFIQSDGKPQNGNGCNIVGNYIEGQIKYGIRMNTGVENFNIVSNYIKGADFTGIEFERTSATVRAGEHSSVKSNYIDGESLRTGTGINMNSVIGIAVKDNYIRECVTGVLASNTDTRLDYVFITQNQFEDCSTNVTVSSGNANGDSSTGNVTIVN